MFVRLESSSTHNSSELLTDLIGGRTIHNNASDQRHQLGWELRLMIGSELLQSRVVRTEPELNASVGLTSVRAATDPAAGL